ncbi:MAG: M23 family metallopeptidase [Candidatus Peribacteraceae bacterium]|nr:M23 family metallopeptidase [Candidatus Peribacteraceae bacterium]
MIFCPLAGTPTVTQGFGQHPEIYQQYGYLGHNGFDFGVPERTKVFAPHDGVCSVKDDGAAGYGKYVVIDGPTRRSLLAHCSQLLVRNGQSISQGDPVALSGKTGNSTASHLHWTFKILKNGVVQNKTNGYDGAMDCSEVTRLWQQQNVHQHAQYTEDAKPYLSMVFKPNQYIKNTTGA